MSGTLAIVSGGRVYLLVGGFYDRSRYAVNDALVFYKGQ